MTTDERVTAWCFECKAQQPSAIVGEDCDEARGLITDSDYYRDGSMVAVRMGSHMRGYRCLVCGDIEADPCIHD